MSFPKIILEGNIKCATALIRRGLSEMFRTDSLAKLAGVPIFRRTVQLNKTDYIYLTVAMGIKIVRIYCEPPVSGEVIDLVPEEDEEFFCPAAFVLYSRQHAETYVPPDGPRKYWTDLFGANWPADLDNRNILIAYNPHLMEWEIAVILGGIVAASNTGYIPEPSRSSFDQNCDIVTWDGQSGGFACWGYNMGYGHRYNEPDGTEASDPVIISGDQQPLGTYPARSGSCHAKHFARGGVRIEGPTGRITVEAQYWNQPQANNGNIYAVYPLGPNIFYCLVSNERSPDTGLQHPRYIWSPDKEDFVTYLDGIVGTEWWSLGGSYTDSLQIYKVDRTDTSSGTKEWDEIEAGDWELQHEFQYNDYCTFGETIAPRGGWGEMAGNAFVTQGGVALFALGIENGIHNEAEHIIGDSVYWLNFISINLLTGEFEILWKESDNTSRPIVSATAGENHSVNLTNAGRPMMIRTFGGLDKLYSYDIEETDNMTSSFKNNTTENFDNSPIWIDGGDPVFYEGKSYDVSESFTESRTAEAWIYCHDRGKTGMTGILDPSEAIIVDSLKVFEIVTNVNVSLSGFLNLGKHYAPDENITGNLGTDLSDIPSGSGSVYMVERRVLDHHPQIPNSWCYIETIESYNRVTGKNGTIVMNYYDMGALVATRSFTRPDQAQSIWFELLTEGHQYPDWHYHRARDGGLDNRGTFLYQEAYARLRRADSLYENYVNDGVTDSLMVDPPGYSGFDNTTTQQTHRGFTHWSTCHYQPYHIQGSYWTNLINLIKPQESPRDNSWVGGMLGRPCFTGNVLPWRGLVAKISTALIYYGYASAHDPYGVWSGSNRPDGMDIQADEFRNNGLYGSAHTFAFDSSLPEWKYMQMHTLPCCAVHRKIVRKDENGDLETIVPYIWLKKKVHATTGPYDMKARIESTPNAVISDTYQKSAFHVKAMFDDPINWPVNYASGEWYVASNIMSATKFEKLLEEVAEEGYPLDFIGIGII